MGHILMMRQVLIAALFVVVAVWAVTEVQELGNDARPMESQHLWTQTTVQSLTIWAKEWAMGVVLLSSPQVVPSLCRLEAVVVAVGKRRTNSVKEWAMDVVLPFSLQVVPLLCRLEAVVVAVGKRKTSRTTNSSMYFPHTPASIKDYIVRDNALNSGDMLWRPQNNKH